MGEELFELQEKLFASGYTGGERRILLVLQGMDTSGKGGVLEHTTGLFDPNGLRIFSFKAADEGGAGPRLPVAGREGGAGAGQGRRLRPLALRGRPDRARPRAGDAGGDRAQVRRDQRVRETARRRRHHDHQVHAAHLRRQAEGAAAGPARRPHQAVEVQAGRRRRAPQVAAVPGGLRDRPRALQHRRRPVVRRAERPQVVPQLGHRQPAAGGSCGRWSCTGPSRTTTWPSSGPGSRTSPWPRERDPHRPGRGPGHPLRRPAPGGRVAARHRRGRRPGHLRLQVPRRRPGPQRAGRRGGRRRSWPGTSGWTRPGWSRSSWTPRSPATRPTRRCRTCSPRASAATSASTSCPARSASTPPSRSRRTSPDGCSGSTPSSPTSTGAGATPTCWSGTGDPG